MAVQFSVAVRNAMLNELNEQALNSYYQLRIYSGSIPQDCASSATGTLIATITPLVSNGPNNAMATASNGVLSKVPTWNYAQAIAQQTAGYFRITNTTGTAFMQGTITLTGGGGDMTFDDITLEVGQPIVVTGFTITAGGA